VAISISEIGLHDGGVLTLKTPSFSSSQQAVTMASMRSLIRVLALCSTIANSLAATAKPALILVPGAFHRASVYDEIKTQLGGVGYGHVDAVDLPSVGDNVADVERTADTNIVIDLLEIRLNSGEDVILIGKSYGATVIMEAVKEFEDHSAVSAHEATEGEGHLLALIMVSTYLVTGDKTLTMCSSPATFLPSPKSTTTLHVPTSAVLVHPSSITTWRRTALLRQ